MTTLRRIDSLITHLGIAGSKSLKQDDGTFIPVIEIDTETGVIYVGGNAIPSAGGSFSWAAVPASATDTGTAGSLAYDTNYIYICVATNTWKRVAVATW